MSSISITKVWFDTDHIYITTSDGRTLGQPLEAFPALFYASKAERDDFYLWDNSRSIRWEKIDEDIHISNFDEPLTPNYDNRVNALLIQTPQIGIKELAEVLGVHYSLLARMKFGLADAPEPMIEKLHAVIENWPAGGSIACEDSVNYG